MRAHHVKNISSDAQIDKQLSNYRRKNNFIKSVVENYSSTIQNRELLTKYLKKGAHMLVTLMTLAIPILVTCVDKILPSPQI